MTKAPENVGSSPNQGSGLPFSNSTTICTIKLSNCNIRKNKHQESPLNHPSRGCQPIYRERNKFEVGKSMLPGYPKDVHSVYTAFPYLVSRASIRTKGIPQRPSNCLERSLGLHQPEAEAVNMRNNFPDESLVYHNSYSQRGTLLGNKQTSQQHGRSFWDFRCAAGSSENSSMRSRLHLDEYELGSRMFPDDCRMIVFLDTIDNVNDSIQKRLCVQSDITTFLNGPAYAAVAGNRGLANVECHVAVTISREFIPVPFQSFITKAVDLKGIRRIRMINMFSNHLSRDNQNWVFGELPNQLFGSQKSVKHLNACMIEFPTSEEAQTFFALTTYANIGNRNWLTFPDSCGVKYWLQFTTINNFSKPFQKSTSCTLTRCWLPFIQPSDASRYVDPEKILPVDSRQGIELSLTGFEILRFHKSLVLLTNSSNIVHNLERLEPDQIPFQRVPRYIVKSINSKLNNAGVRIGLVLFEKGKEAIMTPAVLASYSGFFNGTELEEL